MDIDHKDGQTGDILRGLTGSIREAVGAKIEEGVARAEEKTNTFKPPVLATPVKIDDIRVLRDGDKDVPRKALGSATSKKSTNTSGSALYFEVFQESSQLIKQ